MPRFRFRSFEARLLCFLLALLLLLLVATFLVVDAAYTRQTRAQLREDLIVGGQVFDRLMRARTQRLAEAARLLSGDFAFKAAYATQDRGTVLSALDNHQARIGADVMILVSLDHRTVVDTLDPRGRRDGFPPPDLIAAAEEHGEAAAVVLLDGRPYQMVVVPLLAPVPVAWIAIGFVVDDALADDLRRLTHAEVSFLAPAPGGGWAVAGSTLPAPRRADLPGRLPPPGRGPDTVALVLGGREYAAHVTEVGGAGVAAVLQRAVDEAFTPVYRMRARLLVVFGVGLVVSAVAGVLIARTVSRPVAALVDAVGGIEQGEYARRVPVTRQDELGVLAAAINRLAAGLAEREERIRHEVGEKTKAEEASRAKSRFLATMSHELRTPLNAIIGFTQVLAKGAYGTLNEKQTEFVTTILTASRHLRSLINDILDLSKIEAGRMTLDLGPVSVREVVADVLATVDPLARQAGLTVEHEVADDLPRLTADAAKVRQMLLNLLSNATKFTPRGGRVRLTAGLEPAADGAGSWVRLAVSDTGIGIRAEDRERIFEAFEQADAPHAREQGGTGLGLALTRRLVTLHGGSITVESDGPNAGSTFTIRLPVRPRVDAPVPVRVGGRP